METYRELPSVEWHRLADHEPFNLGGLPDPERWRIIVAEDESGTIVGLCGLYDAVHLDPFWIREDHRHTAVFEGLWLKTKETLQGAGVTIVFSTVSDALPEMHALLRRFGYQPAPGKLYLLSISEAII